MHNFTSTPPNKLGYFSPQTAATNFCEIDYDTTPYIAEFINTLTNLAYIYASFFTLTGATGWRNIASWPWINTALLLVGIGSAAYHATLQHSAQMADEFSMYILITTLNHRVYTYKWFASPEAKRILAASLVAATTYVTFLNMTAPDGANTALHLMLFVGLVTTFWPRMLWLIFHDTPASNPQRKANGLSPSSSAVGQQSTEDRDALRRARLLKFLLGAFSFMSGFGVWLIDGLYCYQLRDIRARIGLPLAWLLELHGAWHVLTAIGAGLFVQLVTDVTSDETWR